MGSLGDGLVSARGCVRLCLHNLKNHLLIYTNDCAAIDRLCIMAIIMQLAVRCYKAVLLYSTGKENTRYPRHRYAAYSA
jgi:hypothetical protein